MSTNPRQPTPCARCMAATVAVGALVCMASATAAPKGADAGDTRIGGLDLRWDATDATRVRAEIARSESDDPARTASAILHIFHTDSQPANPSGHNRLHLNLFLQTPRETQFGAEFRRDFDYL